MQRYVTAKRSGALILDRHVEPANYARIRLATDLLCTGAELSRVALSDVRSVKLPSTRSH